MADRPVATLSAALIALALIGSSCGSTGDDETTGIDEPALEAGSANNGEQETPPESETTSSTEAQQEGENEDEGEAAGGSAEETGDSDSPSSLLISDPDASVPDALTAGLTQPELRNLLVDIHGPTDDVAAELNRVGIFPTDIPTPDGADIYDFTITTTVIDELNSHVRTDLRLFIPAEPADAAVFFESSLVAAGYELVGTGTENRDDVEVKTFEFDVANTETNLSFGLDLSLIDGDFDGTLVILEHYDGLDESQWPLAREQMDALRAWSGNTPIPPGGTLDGTVLQSNINNSVYSFHWLNVHERWRFEGQKGEDVAVAFFDNVAGSDFEFKPLEGDPAPAEALRLAEEEDKSFLLLGMRRDGEFNGPRVTLSDLFSDKPDSTLEFTGGSTDLFGNYTSYE